MNILFGKRGKFEVNSPDLTYKVHYLGNVMTSLIKNVYHQSSKSKYNELNNRSLSAKSDQDEDGNDDLLEFALKKESSAVSVDKPVKILWENHLKHNGQAGLKMKLSITQGGLRVNTKDHGLTEYYGHRIHFIQAHSFHPKLFVWVYQHVGKNLKTEIRCHAALCERARDAKAIETLLNERIQRTFLDYKREKKRQQNSRLCQKKIGVIQNGAKRRISMTHTYKPPVQHGMSSAPKLDDVVEEEEEEEEEDEEMSQRADLRKRFETMVIVASTEQKTIDNEENGMKQEIEKSEEDHVEEEEEEEEDDDQSISDFEADEEVKKIQTANTRTSRFYEDEEIDQENELQEEEEEDEEEDFYDHSDLDLTETTISSANTPQYDNRPTTQLMLLSMSSSPVSTTSSSSSSANDLEIRKNLMCKLAQTPTPITNKTINNQNMMMRINTKEALPTSQVYNNKEYTEVSYEFLSDLSKVDRMKKKLTHSKSFHKTTNTSSSSSSSSNNRNPMFNQQQQQNQSNPFARSTFSRSFSAFTSRLKQQLREESQRALNNIREEKKSSFVDKHNLKRSELLLNNKANLKHKTDEMPSPTLSAYSSSSSASSSSASPINSNTCSTNNLNNANKSHINKNNPNEIVISL